FAEMWSRLEHEFRDQHLMRLARDLRPYNERQNLPWGFEPMLLGRELRESVLLLNLAFVSELCQNYRMRIGTIERNRLGTRSKMLVFLPIRSHRARYSPGSQRTENPQAIPDHSSTLQRTPPHQPPPLSHCISNACADGHRPGREPKILVRHDL